MSQCQYILVQHLAVGLERELGISLYREDTPAARRTSEIDERLAEASPEAFATEFVRRLASSDDLATGFVRRLLRDPSSPLHDQSNVAPFDMNGFAFRNDSGRAAGEEPPE